MKTDMLDIIECIEHLPALPSTTVRLVHLLGNKSSTVEQILDVIQYDQAITLQTLKLCNSAYFGLIRQIHSLKEALVYLGNRQIMQIVLGIHCNAILQQPRKGYGLLSGMLWRHSTAVALAAERMGALIGKDNCASGLLFTAGLLHDIGKVVLDQVLSENYLQVLESLDTQSTRFDVAEKEHLGFSHTEIGERILLYWQLPELLSASGRYHHEPGEYRGTCPQTRESIDLVHLADSLVISLGLGVGNDGLYYRLNMELAEQYNLKREILDQISAQVVQELESLEQMYQEK